MATKVSFKGVMSSKVTFKGANELQKATINFNNQNNNLRSAIEALKCIAHRPICAIPNKNKFLGITSEDRKKISDFIEFLETKEMPMRELFEYVLMNEVINEVE